MKEIWQFFNLVALKKILNKLRLSLICDPNLLHYFYFLVFLNQPVCLIAVLSRIAIVASFSL